MISLKDSDIIHWRVHLNSAPHDVYRVLATDEGRAQFWAESARETDGKIEFKFPNGATWAGEILANQPPSLFAIRYWGGSIVTFRLVDDGAGGTDLDLTDAGVPAEWQTDTEAGWVSVLLALKAAVDFGVDLRNHDPLRTWAQRFADN